MNVCPDPAEYDHINRSAAEVECALLGTCLMNSNAMLLAAGVVAGEHFKESLHQVLWATMVEMAADGRAVNNVTLVAKLGNAKSDSGQSLSQYLARCAADTHCSPAYVVDFAKHVREFWALRQVAARGEDAKQAALIPGAVAKHLIGDLIMDLDQTRAVIESRPVAGRMVVDGTDAVLDRMNRIMTGEVVDVFMTTGLKDLDRKLGGGFKSGELIVIAGRPGMGKTTVAVSLSRQMAKAGHAGGFFSLEMPEHQISARFIADVAFGAGISLNANQILNGHLQNASAERAIDAGRTFGTLPLALDDSSSLTVGEIRARTYTWKNRFERAGKKLEFIVVDYLKFIRASDRYRGQRNLEVGEITGGLKALAKDLGIAVLLLCQLNRETEKTSDRRPELAHLRDSGEIEQDADVVLFLFRDAYYLANDPKGDPARLAEVQNLLEIICAKQRMGPTGSVHVFCNPGASAVRDLGRAA